MSVTPEEILALHPKPSVWRTILKVKEANVYYYVDTTPEGFAERYDQARSGEGWIKAYLTPLVGAVEGPPEARQDIWVPIEQIVSWWAEA